MYRDGCSRYDHGELPHCAIIDRMTTRQIESWRLNLTDALSLADSEADDDSGAMLTIDSEECDRELPWELYVELPYFDHPVIFDDQVYDSVDATPVPLVATGPAVPKKLDVVSSA